MVLVNLSAFHLVMHLVDKFQSSCLPKICMIWRCGYNVCHTVVHSLDTAHHTTVEFVSSDRLVYHFWDVYTHKLLWTKAYKECRLLRMVHQLDAFHKPYQRGVVLLHSKCRLL